MRCHMKNILARASIGISELKSNPSAAIHRADGPVAILNRNTPVAYLVPAADWEAICERLDDAELADLIRSRACETPVSTQLDDL